MSVILCYSRYYTIAGVLFVRLFVVNSEGDSAVLVQIYAESKTNDTSVISLITR